MLEEDGFEVWRGEDVGEIVSAWGVEDVGEALVRREAGEDLERLGRAIS